MSVKKTTTVLATLVASASLATGGAVASQSETSSERRGQAIIVAVYDRGKVPACDPTPSPPTTTVNVYGFVRYADGDTWRARRGASVHIQKRTSTGSWVTVEKANTGWEPGDVDDRKGWYHDSFTSYVPTPSQRVFRLFVPRTDRYQAVYSRTFTAVPWCE